MEAWEKVVLLTLVAGMAMPLGGWIAQVERLGPNWLENELRHGIIAFGGGALLSAVALVLVPNSLEALAPGPAMLWFLAGGLAFMGIDILLDRNGTSASQLTAMLSDFLPEALALGAAFTYGGGSGVLLALLMTLQNLPEGFNAYRELRETTHYSARRLLTLFFAMAWLGPLAGPAGGAGRALVAGRLPHHGGRDHAVRRRRHPLLGVSGPGPPGPPRTPLGAAAGRGARLRHGHRRSHADPLMGHR